MLRGSGVVWLVSLFTDCCKPITKDGAYLSALLWINQVSRCQINCKTASVLLTLSRRTDATAITGPRHDICLVKDLQRPSCILHHRYILDYFSHISSGLHLHELAMTVVSQHDYVQFMKRASNCASYPTIAEVTAHAKELDEAPYQ